MNGSQAGGDALTYLQGGHVVHVCRLVEECGHLGHLVHDVLVYLLAGHDQQKPLQVVWSDLVEDDLDVELVVQP